MGKDEGPEAAGLLMGHPGEAPAVVDTPSFFSSGPRIRRDTAWAVAYFCAFALSLILGGVAASQANPAFDVLSSPSALAVRSAIGARLSRAGWRPRRLAGAWGRSAATRRRAVVTKLCCGCARAGRRASSTAYGSSLALARSRSLHSRFAGVRDLPR